MAKHEKAAFENEEKNDHSLFQFIKYVKPIAAHQKVVTHPHNLPSPLSARNNERSLYNLIRHA